MDIHCRRRYQWSAICHYTVYILALRCHQGFLAHVLTTLPPSELNDTIFRIEGERATLLEVASILNAPVEFVEKVPGDKDGVLTLLSTKFEEGKPYTSWSPADGRNLEGKEGNHNYLWPAHEWKSIKEALGL